MVSLRLVVLHVALQSIFVELNDLSKLVVQTNPLMSCHHMPGEKAYMASLRAIKNKNDLDNRLDQVQDLQEYCRQSPASLS